MGGGGGGGALPLESQQGPPSIDFDALIAPGLAALDQADQAAQAALGAREAEAEQFRVGETARAEEARTTGGQAVEKGQTQATTAAGAADVQQRRGLAEITQQLTGRFGRSGFGQGVIGQIGAQTLTNLSNIKTGLAETIQDLTVRRQNLEDVFNNTIKEVSAQTETFKQNAQAGLRQALATIGAERGQLQSQKALAVQQSVENYRQTIAAVNQRNTQFQQDFFLQKEAARQKVDSRLAQSQSLAENLEEFSLTKGQTRFLTTTTLPDQGQQVAAGTNVQVGTAGPFTTFGLPGEEDKDLF